MLKSSDVAAKRTEYKTFKGYLVKLGSGKYRSTTALLWKKIPKNRGVDIMSATPRYAKYFNLNRHKRSAKQYWEATGTYRSKPVNEHGTIRYSSTSSKWLDRTTSAGIAPNLKDNYQTKYNNSTVYMKVKKIKLKMYYNFNLDVSYNKYPHNEVEVKSAYRHQISSGGYGLSSVDLSYDNISFNFDSLDEEFDSQINAIPKITR